MRAGDFSVWREAGAASHWRAGFQAAYREDFCHICQVPVHEMIDDCPCLHWCMKSWRKEHLSAVLAAYGPEHVASYLQECAAAEKLRGSRAAVRASLEGGVERITINIKNRSWQFDFPAGRAGEGAVQLVNRRTGTGCAMSFFVPAPGVRTVP